MTYLATAESVGEGWESSEMAAKRWNVFIAPILQRFEADNAVKDRVWGQFCEAGAGDSDDIAEILADSIIERLEMNYSSKIELEEKLVQVIWNGTDAHVIANATNSVVPEWPVQDDEGHWHNESFPGQRVIFHQGKVFFGELLEEVSEIPVDDDGEMVDGYTVAYGRFFKL